MATLRADDPTPQAPADADYLLDSALRTLKTAAADGQDRLTYVRRFKGKKALTGDEKVAEGLAISASSTPPSPTVAPTASTASSPPCGGGQRCASTNTNIDTRTEKDRKARDRKKLEGADHDKKAATLHTDRRAGKAAPETEEETD
eukprot:jgi/Tetstr1/434378/TSEL_023479.t1